MAHLRAIGTRIERMRHGFFKKVIEFEVGLFEKFYPSKLKIRFSIYLDNTSAKAKDKIEDGSNCRHILLFLALLRHLGDFDQVVVLFWDLRRKGTRHDHQR